MAALSISDVRREGELVKFHIPFSHNMCIRCENIVGDLYFHVCKVIQTGSAISAVRVEFEDNLFDHHNHPPTIALLLHFSIQYFRFTLTFNSKVMEDFRISQ